LQTDVFVRTNEVLSKIQSSTGVTEKRIEDIISGRTAVIASEVIDKSMTKGAKTFATENIEQIKKDLAESLRNELLPLLSRSSSGTEERLTELEVKQKHRKDIRNKWARFRSSLVAEASKHTGIQIKSESEGALNSNTPEQFWDAVFIIDDKLYSLESHITEQLYDTEGSFSLLLNEQSERFNYASKISWRVSQDNIQVLILAWDNDVSEEPAIKEIIALVKKSNPMVDIRLIHGTPEAIIKSLAS